MPIKPWQFSTLVPVLPSNPHHTVGKEWKEKGRTAVYINQIVATISGKVFPRAQIVPYKENKRTLILESWSPVSNPKHRIKLPGLHPSPSIYNKGLTMSVNSTEKLKLLICGQCSLYNNFPHRHFSSGYEILHSSLSESIWCESYMDKSWYILFKESYSY